MTVTKEKIVPLNKGAGYLEARKLTAEKGSKLPSNVLHDDVLVRSDDWRQISDAYPLWAREVLVYPAKGSKFEKGKDVVDSQTGWILPASYVPEQAVGKQNMGLFVDPRDVTKENGKVIVHPENLVVLASFIQNSGDSGKVDEQTRVPLNLPLDSEDQKRYLWRIGGSGVRPLLRDVGYDDGRRYVDAYDWPDDGCGVAIVGLVEAATQGTTVNTELIVKGLSPTEVRNRLAMLNQSAGAFSTEIRELLAAIEIK